MDLTRFPRARLAHLPTLLEPLSRLSAVLGGSEIWIKRDDCMGLAGYAHACDAPDKAGA